MFCKFHSFSTFKEYWYKNHIKWELCRQTIKTTNGAKHIWGDIYKQWYSEEKGDITHKEKHVKGWWQLIHVTRHGEVKVAILVSISDMGHKWCLYVCSDLNDRIKEIHQTGVNTVDLSSIFMVLNSVILQYTEYINASFLYPHMPSSAYIIF